MLKRALPLRLVVAWLLFLGASGLAARQAQVPGVFPVDDLKPGMTGIGRTVFSGDTIEDFKVQIIGVLRNVIGPQRDLVLARLDGGPLASTGVIAGMSGSPVYIDGKLLGAVSYALGSFPKEPIAGITPIGEMVEAVNAAGPRVPPRLPSSPATPMTDVFATLAQLAQQAGAPLGRLPGDTRILGPASIADLAPALRPIGVAMVLNGFDPAVDRDLRQALAIAKTDQSPTGARTNGMSTTPLRPGDPVGASLIHGDFEMGATGTVTHVDGNRVYAFGHPFLNLGPTQYAMTRAHVYTVLPSLDSSMKIATLGPVIGTIGQDRATAVGGMMGVPPRELEVNLTLASDRAPERKLKFFVLHDQILTPLFAYVAVLNSLVSYERQAGSLTVSASGKISFGNEGAVEIDDIFTGDTTASLSSMGVTAAIAAAATNEFRPALPDRMDMTLRVGERQQSATIERAWLDTTRPKTGATHTLQVMLRNYRGDTETVSIPIAMPAQASGPLTLLVSDAPTLAALEQRELRPAKPATWPALLGQLNTARRNNRLYVRLISTSAGTVVAGDTLPALPASVRSVLDDDKTVATSAVSKTVIGAWEQRLDRAVRGSRELTITLTSRQ